MRFPTLRNALGFLGFGILAGIIVALYARFIEPKRLEVTHLDLSHDDDPLTIAFVTDTHVGPNYTAEYLEPLIAEMERIRPDIILFGGDFISESPRFLKQLEPALTRITATASSGCWGIWGNHDIANIRSKMEPVLERCGVNMLCNESAQLRGDLWVVGVDDALLGKVDIEASFAGLPTGARTIALWHEPDLAERIAPYKPVILLSGHTHGGQVRLPGIGALAAPNLGEKYVAGQFDVKGMILYVSRGIGMYRPPVRLNCRPELLVFTID